jgi:sec-independent protein translocase protein TatA
VLTLVSSLALFTLGLGEMVLIVAVIMLLFGAKKLPGLARGLGEGIRNFKGALKPPPDDDSHDRK